MRDETETESDDEQRGKKRTETGKPEKEKERKIMHIAEMGVQMQRGAPRDQRLGPEKIEVLAIRSAECAGESI